MLVVVGSTNVAKIEAVKLAFEVMFPEKKIRSIGLSVVSGVRRQPLSDDECLLGTRNRAFEAFSMMPDADFAIGLENGICSVGKSWIDPESDICLLEKLWFARGWVMVMNKQRQESFGSTISLLIPNNIVEELRVNPDDELGSLLDRKLDRTGIKYEEWCIGVVINRCLTHRSTFKDAVICALAPLVNSHLFETPIKTPKIS